MIKPINGRFQKFKTLFKRKILILIVVVYEFRESGFKKIKIEKRPENYILWKLIMYKENKINREVRIQSGCFFIVFIVINLIIWVCLVILLHFFM